MAQLGFRNFDEMIGRIDRISTKKAIEHWKAKKLDFSSIFIPPPKNAIVRCIKTHSPEPKCLDDELITKSMPAIEKQKQVTLFSHIRNTDRSVGAKLSWAVTKRYGSKGLPENTIICNFTGVAGQSFGAFLAPGITFELEGESNDYVGKGLSGGRIIIFPPRRSSYRTQNNIIAGNVCLFGATSGEVFINGMVGERFAVRNSGAVAVVEGLGDHGCEYMTGGTVVVLGPVGINFAAGMSGGIAYVLDENQLFDTKCNLDMVDLELVTDEKEANFIFNLIQKHVKYTGSKYAASILKNWEEMLPKFIKVFPIDYRKALERIKQTESKESDVSSLTEEVFL